MGTATQFTCALCGHSAEAKFAGDVCPKCNESYWKCSKCGHMLQAVAPPNACPSCKETCEFLNATCYTPECGGPGHLDPRI
jgi:rubrerythrin